MPTDAERLRDALAAYRVHADRPDGDPAQHAYNRLRDVAEEIQRKAPRR